MRYVCADVLSGTQVKMYLNTDCYQSLPYALIHRDFHGGSPKRVLGGFLAHEINFHRENREIFMNPLNQRGISPIEESAAQK